MLKKKRSRVAAMAALALAGLSLSVPMARADSTHKISNGLTAACEQVLVLGARGSGQTQDDADGLGPQVAGLVAAYAARTTVGSVAYYPVNYPSYSVGVRIGTYFTGLDWGVNDVLTVLDRRRSACPNERVVLAGYSQGAMVMHRVVWELAKRTNGFANVDAVVAIADGDRVPFQGGLRYGTSGTGPRNYGVSFGVSPAEAGKTYKPQWRSLPTAIAGRFHSICDSGDIVCDFGATSGLWSLYQGKQIHTSHYGATSSAVLAAAGAAATYTNAHRPSSSSPVPPALGTGKVLASPCLNLRSGPSGPTTLIGCIPQGATIAVECTAEGNAVAGPYGTETIWDRTSYSGQSGYVSDAWVYTGTNGAVAPACGTTSPAPQPVPSSTTGRVLASPCLNFRSGPSGSTTLIGCIPVDSVIPIVCTTQGNAVTGPYGTETIWDRTSYAGQTGYVSDAWVYTGSNGAVAPSC